MKKLIILLFVAAILCSCGGGRWVGGNAKHFQQRKDAKERKSTIVENKKKL